MRLWARPSGKGRDITLGFFVFIAVLLALPTPMEAQGTRLWLESEAQIDGGIEEYLRYLQTDGRVPLRPWSIRGFTPEAFQKISTVDGEHPWSRLAAFADSVPPTSRIRWLPARTRMTYNSGFPYGWNDGAVWTGKGLTAEMSFGGAVELGPLSLILAPTAFYSFNDRFPLAPNGQDPARRFADPWEPTTIDRPQRFGDGDYYRVDPGQSTLRIDLPWVDFGLSTANQWWGPAFEHPLILGNNAAGVPHAFLGPDRPIDIYVGSIDGRVIWGRLEDSPYWVPDPSVEDAWRLMTGTVATFTPRGLDGLEIGVSRIFHSLLLEGQFSSDQIIQPFGALLKRATGIAGVENGEEIAGNNQLASAFFRWAFPPAGFEFYGEYAREDHSYDLRDFLLEIDQQRAYLMGLRKTWWRSEDSFLALRMELANGQVSPVKQVRPASPFYRHTGVRQGHTNRGQPLGSAALFTGGGSVIGIDLYDRTGQWSFDWYRNLGDGGRPTLPVEADVQHALAVKRTLFLEDYVLNSGLDLVYNFNRNQIQDEVNLRAFLGVQWSPEGLLDRRRRR